MQTFKEQVNYFVKATGYRRVLLLAALALVSSLLSNFCQFGSWKILQATFLHGNDLAAPILPGIYFGAVLAVGAYAWKRKSLFAACVILFSTVIAWVVAWECAYNTVGHLNDLCKNAAAEPLLGPNTLRIILFLFGGIAGGFVGGLITLVGISIAISEVGTINNWWRTLFVASFAGTALGYYGYDGGSFILLFVVWQVAVAASIAFGWSFKETWKTASPLRARRR